ncbi:MAG: hypothetical protein C0200_07395 [Thermoproteota archaeon]|nr:MAG: hypothetical protein C0200_07395 [Candidatus Korarchaeota archaeon]
MSERSERIIEGALRSFISGRKVEIRDLFPELKLEGSYVLFDPPVPYGRSTRSPGFNIGSLLASGLFDFILIPLVPYNAVEDFVYSYALSNSFGFSFDDLLYFIEMGRVKVILMDDENAYRTSFYREIFKACENSGYIPPNAPGRILSFFRYLRIIETAENIPEDSSAASILGFKGKGREFNEYFVVPCAVALLGFRNYGMQDLKRMNSLGMYNPAQLSFVTREIEMSFPRDPAVFKKIAEMRTDSLSELDKMTDGTRYDLKEKLDELEEFSRFLDAEIRKLGCGVVKRSFRFGKAFIFLPGALRYVSNDLTQLSELKTDPENIAARKWPFSKPGYPFILWEDGFRFT